jgi:GT2 family glycosyltransferase
LKQLSIIIVNYNVYHFLEQSLKSVIKAIAHLEAEIIVVDNNSVDGSVMKIRKNFPDITLIANDVNVGFSKANNQAINQAKGEYVLLLNPDTVVPEDTLEKCVSFMNDHTDAGGLGVKMVDGKGQFLPESKRGLPSPSVAFYKMFGLSALFPKSKKFGRYHLGYMPKEETNEIEVLSGAYMFLRKSVLDKIGLLDEDYFMYGEDIDLSYRILKAGYKNYYFPKATIIHYKGESTKRTSINYVFIFYRAMIIFAKKHFSSRNASILSFLINLAIYLKAGFQIVRNFISSSYLTLMDSVLIFGGMYGLKIYWEHNYKLDPTPFPDEYVRVAIPIYIVFWLICNHFSGGNDRPYRISKILRGILVGTILISAVSNFFDEFRYSKALILLGGSFSFLAIVWNRYFVQWLKYKNFDLSETKGKRTALVGAKNEAERVISLLKSSYANLNIVGYISTNPDEPQNGTQRLGMLSQLDEIAEVYSLEEIIFCSKDIPAHHIIENMIRIKKEKIEFKIVPDNSNYVIGSNSKNSQGSFYTVDVTLNLAQKGSYRNKRVFDILLSLFFLSTFPLAVFTVKKPLGFIQNIFSALIGKRTWVGFMHDENISLPKIKKSVLPSVLLDKRTRIDEDTEKRLDMLYAKDYSVSMDLEIVLKSWRYLGGYKNSQ